VHIELEDIVAWHFDPKGMFLVQSATRSSENMQKGMAKGELHQHQMMDYWKKGNGKCCGA
jgi:hypothetical protein